MADTHQFLVMLSVQDVIGILENDPVKGNPVHEFTAIKFMNRVSIAHLSIERAFKTLITVAGATYCEIHNLKRLCLQLRKHDSAAAEFLEAAFDAAVRHYRYNPNAVNMTHLKTLESYLEVVGTDRVFEDVRYWELEQSLDEVILRRIYLTLHIELLHALSELLLAPTRPMETVADRVERIVYDALIPTADLRFSPGTPEEQSVHGYIQWLQGFTTSSAALADAVQRSFNIGDDFMASIAKKAYATLLESPDPAVTYFTNTLDVLPPQPRGVLPNVEWLGPEEFRSGPVKTPAGILLGYIERGLDGLWYVSPFQAGQLKVSATAHSQTDARSYLATMLTRPVEATVEGEIRTLRIVGEEYHLFQKNYEKMRGRTEETGDDDTWTHKVTLWDKDHGLKVGDNASLKLRSMAHEGVVHILKGTVTDVQGHEVYLSGNEILGSELQT